MCLALATGFRYGTFRGRWGGRGRGRGEGGREEGGKREIRSHPERSAWNQSTQKLRAFTRLLGSLTHFEQARGLSCRKLTALCAEQNWEVAP